MVAGVGYGHGQLRSHVSQPIRSRSRDGGIRSIDFWPVITGMCRGRAVRQGGALRHQGGGIGIDGVAWATAIANVTAERTTTAIISGIRLITSSSWGSTCSSIACTRPEYR